MKKNFLLLRAIAALLLIFWTRHTHAQETFFGVKAGIAFPARDKGFADANPDKIYEYKSFPSYALGFSGGHIWRSGFGFDLGLDVVHINYSFRRNKFNSSLDPGSFYKENGNVEIIHIPFHISWQDTINNRKAVLRLIAGISLNKITFRQPDFVPNYIRGFTHGPDTFEIKDHIGIYSDRNEILPALECGIALRLGNKKLRDFEIGIHCNLLLKTAHLGYLRNELINLNHGSVELHSGALNLRPSFLMLYIQYNFASLRRNEEEGHE